jgi:hypothetical protein
MVALGILVVSLAILVETQSNAAMMTAEAEAIIMAGDLANTKANEVILIVEEDGFQSSDIYESGEFEDLGDDATSLEFGDELDQYHWEYWISEIDMDLAGDVVEMMGEVDSSGFLGGSGGGLAEMGLGGASGGMPGGLGNMGIGGGQITEMIGPYIREVRVRVWWGEDSERAEEIGNEVIITTHVINPTGVILDVESQGLAQ